MSLQTTLLSIIEIRNLNGYKNKNSSLMKNTSFEICTIKLELYLLHLSEKVSETTTTHQQLTKEF